MTTTKVPIVAIVGRANVGKSSLFNAMLQRRESIVAREAGTTRDNVMAKASFANQQFWLVDTAGLKDPEDEFEESIQSQIRQAGDSADIILVVVESDVPISTEDRQVADLALKSRKPTVLVVNKIDKPNTDIDQFVRLGIKTTVPTSTSPLPDSLTMPAIFWSKATSISLTSINKKQISDCSIAAKERRTLKCSTPL